MPFIQITLPQQALSDEQKNTLAQQATDCLLKLEGMEHNSKAKMLSWLSFNEYPKGGFFIGGKLNDKPHYKFDITVFANTLQEDHKSRLTAELTELVLNLEGTDHNLLNAARIWVLFHEIKDGNWGGAGQIYHLPQLMKMMQP